MCANKSIIIALLLASLSAFGAGLSLEKDYFSRPDLYMTGIAGWWPLNEGGGLVTADKSGRGNNGTISNATWNASVPLVKFVDPSSMRFNGTNQCVVLGTQTTNITAYPLTAMVWLKPVGTGVQRKVLYSRTALGQFQMYFGIVVQPSNYVSAVVNDGTTTVTSAGVYIADGNWHHAAVEATSNSLLFYCDGVFISSNAISQRYNGVASTWIGGDPSSNGTLMYNGYADDPRIYHDLLPAKVIARIALPTNSVINKIMGGTQ